MQCPVSAHETHPHLRGASARRELGDGADDPRRRVGGVANHGAAQSRRQPAFREHQHRLAGRQRGGRREAGDHPRGTAHQDHPGSEDDVERHPRWLLLRADRAGAGRPCADRRGRRAAAGGATAQPAAGNRAAIGLRRAPARLGGGGAGHRRRAFGRAHPVGAPDAERALDARRGRRAVPRPARAGDRHSGGGAHAVGTGPHLRRAGGAARGPLQRRAGRGHWQRTALAPAQELGSAPGAGGVRGVARAYRTRPRALGRHRPH